MSNLFATPMSAKSNSKLIDEPGNYEVTIIAADMATPEKSEAIFHDGIQQLKLTGTNKEGKILSLFINQVAFAKFEDLTEKEKQSGKYTTKEYEGTTYAINKLSGKRLPLPMNMESDVIDKTNHKKSQAVKDIYRGHAFDCGLEDIESAADFRGAKCIFVIKEENGRLKVVGTKPASKATVSAESSF
jgi:hypothetical protein